MTEAPTSSPSPEAPAEHVRAIEGGAGTVGGADVIGIEVTRHRAELSALALSVPVELSPEFSPEQNEYRVDTSIVVQGAAARPSIRVTARTRPPAQIAAAAQAGSPASPTP